MTMILMEKMMMMVITIKMLDRSFNRFVFLFSNMKTWFNTWSTVQNGFGSNKRIFKSCQNEMGRVVLV